MDPYGKCWPKKTIFGRSRRHGRLPCSHWRTRLRFSLKFGCLVSSVLGLLDADWRFFLDGLLVHCFSFTLHYAMLLLVLFVTPSSVKFPQLGSGPKPLSSLESHTSSLVSLTLLSCLISSTLPS
ncbi:hypothetical protein CNBF4230 [Cryptococcus deneoformans B-3501A]|uniref:hypothetical protein n=1 Tax=Cryptococcus deneoformans (strain B-3501A) TaxID=283643 RepID=UPI000042D020|nr:hypothetical protein CNBF4230 [Cryptococcus neoformans var. neoformans B-3501A]EAL20097.1 hypothetical protein CNBF4230 [Cryptococcus neoformans var. neoformans B-3501A]